ncbi:hypothetical protein CDL12_01530 [Handroanthus impetiginosus]|uniref:Uncharacterized protein n=1 Tax=Handroanthus impetiginosus TaxID=429701 RepID=A0A2G9I7L4_9LAMI|nr:hypothetical protein CDL12_01530 [Handroanthus impetiginosus]
MALSPLRSKTLHHGRSLSMPSESRPAMSQFDENLSRIRALGATCSSLSSMNARINELKNLYDSMDDLLQLPQNFSLEGQEQILDDYIRLLDACSTVKDLISLTKQGVRELLSAVRRKDANVTQSYLTSRRKSKKMIQKSLNNLRSFGSKSNAVSLEKDMLKDAESKDMLKDAESVTLSLFEFLLSYVMGTKVQERKSGWSLVSKLMHFKKVSPQDEETDLNEFKKVASFLQLSQESWVEQLVNHLKGMDSSIQILEEGLEVLFRLLIKTRVSLLNTLNH